jgi:SNF2 family DNA or RNA helicase
MVVKQTWEHQIPCIEYLNSNDRVLLDAVMGSGKSYMTVNHCQHQFSGPKDKILIIPPASVLGVWRREFNKHAPEQFDNLVLDDNWTSEKKAELTHDHIRRQVAVRRPAIVVVNYESFWRDKLFKVIMDTKWDKIICDESHRIKSYSATCSKKAHDVTKMGVKSRLCLTGTPMANGPQDIFGQYRFLNDTIFGRYWTHFKRQYAVENPHVPGMIIQWINQEEFKQKVAKLRYYIGPEVLSLPDKSDTFIYTKLAPAGRKAYDQMKKEALVELNIQTSSGEPQIASAQNGAVQFLRLLQLAQGYVKTTEGEEVNTDTEKRRALLDILEGLNEPVCVYGWFKHDLACVKKCCEILGRRYGELSGDRHDLTPNAEMPDDVDIMAVQCKSGSAGIDLTRAAVGIIMNSGMLSPGDYDQMMARQYRPGQTRNVRFLHLVTERTVETKLIDSRGKKRDCIRAMLSDIVDPADEVF